MPKVGLTFARCRCVAFCRPREPNGIDVVCEEAGLHEEVHQVGVWFEEIDDLFFFSSRRRHTRCSRDWSSDVCSSDLPVYRVARKRQADGDGRGVKTICGVAYLLRPTDAEQTESAHRRHQGVEPGEYIHQIGRASCRERLEIRAWRLSMCGTADSTHVK